MFTKIDVDLIQVKNLSYSSGSAKGLPSTDDEKGFEAVRFSPQLTSAVCNTHKNIDINKNEQTLKKHLERIDKPTD